jgi:hypothetical protein
VIEVVAQSVAEHVRSVTESVSVRTAVRAACGPVQCHAPTFTRGLIHGNATAEKEGNAGRTRFRRRSCRPCVRPTSSDSARVVDIDGLKSSRRHIGSTRSALLSSVEEHLLQIQSRPVPNSASVRGDWPGSYRQCLGIPLRSGPPGRVGLPLGLGPEPVRAYSRTPRSGWPRRTGYRTIRRSRARWNGSSRP